MTPEISNAVNKVKSSHDDDGSGRVCNFYKVSDNTGAKVYYNHATANKNWLSQIALAGHGIAPKVLSDIIEFNDCLDPALVDVTRYMFLTELATTVYQICVDEGLACEDCYSNCNCDCDMEDPNIDCDFADCDRFEDMNELFEKMSNLELRDMDNHWGNYGYLKNGTAVVIDCEFYHLYD